MIIYTHERVKILVKFLKGDKTYLFYVLVWLLICLTLKISPDTHFKEDLISNIQVKGKVLYI